MFLIILKSASNVLKMFLFLMVGNILPTAIKEQ